jgi:transcriptional regulator with XRE-family HTH domain
MSKDSNVNNLHRNLDFLLQKTGIKQNFLAQELGVSKHTVVWWKRNAIPRHRLEQISRYFASRIPALALTPDALLNEDLQAALSGDHRQIKETILGDPSPEAMTQGLEEFLTDKKNMTLLKPTEEEIQILKNIRFYHGRYQPSKDFYVEILFDIRKSKEQK